MSKDKRLIKSILLSVSVLGYSIYAIWGSSWSIWDYLLCALLYILVFFNIFTSFFKAHRSYYEKADRHYYYPTLLYLFSFILGITIYQGYGYYEKSIRYMQAYAVYPYDKMIFYDDGSCKLMYGDFWSKNSLSVRYKITGNTIILGRKISANGEKLENIMKIENNKIYYRISDSELFSGDYSARIEHEE